MDQVVSQTTYPKLVAVGENPMKLNSVLLCVEGQGEDVTSYPMDTIFYLVCFLLRFSIVYPHEFKDFFVLIHC